MKHTFVHLLLLSGLFLLLTNHSSYGQILKAHPNGGIHMSATNSSIDSIRTGKNGMRGGYNVGLDLRLGGYDSWVYFQPGAHFYQARLDIYTLEDFTSVENYKHTEMQVSQIKLPMNLGFYLTGTDGLLKIRASAGLTPSMVVDQSETQLNEEVTKFSTFGVGVNAGIGLDLTVLTLDLRYEHGSTKIYKSANANMNFISLTAGFIIPPSF